MVTGEFMRTNGSVTGPGLLALAATAALGATLLAGCGSDSGSGKSADGTTTVTVGISNNIFDMSIRVADANGYFKEHGIKVKYVTLTAATGPAALQSGSVQFLNSSPTGFVSAVTKGIPLTAIATNGGGNPLGLVVSNKFAKAHGLTAKTPADQVAAALAGSTGGASSTNTQAEAGIFLKAQNVDPDKVKWVSLPSPAADKASLKSNQIDWFVTSEPIPLNIQNSGDGVVVADPIKVPQWSSTEAGYGQVVVARTSYAKQNSDIAKKFSAAVQEATGYLKANLQDKTVLSVAKSAMPGIPGPVLQASLEQVDWPVDDEMNESGWNTTMAFLNQLGAFPAGTTISTKNWTNDYLQ
jgi:ABC-type nitrate/sulfonate/bicarbonate transport system substrate-binding protein